MVVISRGEGELFVSTMLGKLGEAKKRKRKEEQWQTGSCGLFCRKSPGSEEDQKSTERSNSSKASKRVDLVVVVVLAKARVLNKCSQDLASSLQQRVSSNTNGSGGKGKRVSEDVSIQCCISSFCSCVAGQSRCGSGVTSDFFFQARKADNDEPSSRSERKQVGKLSSSTYICKKRSNPSRRCSITSSVKRLVKTFPGRGGMLTLDDSLSNTSRNHSKSE